MSRGRATLSDSQEQILDAVMACIARDGIEGTSMRSVAREADVSLGLLSYHFASKQALIVAAFQLATDRLLAVTQASVTGVDDPVARVRAWVRGAFKPEFLTRDYLALRLSLWAISRIDDEVAAAERLLYERYAASLVAYICAACPDVDEAEARHRVTDVIVTQNGLWLNWARYRDEEALERGLRQCERLALGG